MDLIESNSVINRHPWELSRVESLIKEINKYQIRGDVLDIGCGDGYFDTELLKRNNNINKLYGIDIYQKEEYNKGKYIVINDYKKLKDKKFDFIIMCDVIEHIEDDSDFLKNTVKKLLKKNGKVIITVPAYQSLFSKHDEALRHYRRYNRKMIKELSKKASFKINKCHYFYASLVFPRILTKLLNKDNAVNNWKYDEKHIITRIIKGVLNTDYFICKKMNRLSFGLSLFAVLSEE